MINKQRTLGDSVLIFITLCWGVTFPLTENAMETVDPFVFVTVRFLLAAFLLLPFIWKDRKHLFNKNLLISGLILGAINMVVYNSQTIGLETISSAQSAFITGVRVIIVPFLLPIFCLGAPKKLDIVSCIFCLLGLALLTGVGNGEMSTGYLWTLLCAFSVAISIVYLQKISKQSISLSVLAFYQILFTGIFSAPFSISKNYSALLDTNVLISLVICASFGTALALLLQTRYQHFTTASRAGMIFCFEPLFASLFGYLINDEKLSALAAVGGTLIIASLLIPELYHMQKMKYQSK